MSQKKSQASVFIFTGIVLLIIVGFTVYVINYSAKKQTQKSIKLTQRQELKTNSIESLINACLEKTAKKGLKLIGEQGGVIFKSQGGMTDELTVAENKDYIAKEGVSIWLGIKRPTTASCVEGDGCLAGCADDTDCEGHVCNAGDNFCVIGCDFVDTDCGSEGATCAEGDGCNSGCVVSDKDCGNVSCEAGNGCISNCNPPDPDCSVYGCNEDGMCALGCELADVDCANNDDRGFNVLEPLYPWKCFPKSLGCFMPITYTGYFGIDILPALEGIDSIGSQLKEFVRNNITTCINFSAFEAQGFDIDKGAISADVIFAEKETVFNLNYPLNIRHYKTGERTSLKDFKYSIGVNLKGIHAYSKELIGQDITDIRVNINGARDSFTAEADDAGNIVTVTDSSSIIDGNAYKFNFARENRRPALEMIGSVAVAVNRDVEQLFNIIINAASSRLHDPDEGIDCSSFTIEECDGECLLARCSKGSIKLECPTIHNFKGHKKVGGPVTQNKPTRGPPEECKATISDGQLEDYQEGIKVEITAASEDDEEE